MSTNDEVISLDLPRDEARLPQIGEKLKAAYKRELERVFERAQKAVKRMKPGQKRVFISKPVRLTVRIKAA